MASVARELAKSGVGVLEPLQTSDSIDGQVNELYAVLNSHGQLPITLVGWSWGAMLSYITAARHPEVVHKLILVSSGVYEHQYTSTIMDTRMSRLNDDERRAIENAFEQINSPDDPERDSALELIGSIFRKKTDSYDLLADPDDDVLKVQSDISHTVWAEANALRQSGELIALGKAIRCPVIAIHGDYDPHPIAGIREPLTPVLDNFRVEILKRCGHYPWQERQAREVFFELLQREI